MSIQVHIAGKKRKPRSPLRRVSSKDLLNNQVEGIDGKPIDSQHELISLMLPPAVKAFFADLEAEVTALCGDRYSHEPAKYGYDLVRRVRFNTPMRSQPWYPRRGLLSGARMKNSMLS